MKQRETYQNNARAWASDDKYRPIPIKSEPSSNNDSTPPTGVSTSLDPPGYPSNAPMVYQPVKAPAQQTTRDTTTPIQTDTEPSNTTDSNDLKIDPQPVIDSNFEQSEEKNTDIKQDTGLRRSTRFKKQTKRLFMDPGNKSYTAIQSNADGQPDAEEISSWTHASTFDTEDAPDFDLSRHLFGPLSMESPLM